MCLIHSFRDAALKLAAQPLYESGDQFSELIAKLDKQLRQLAEEVARGQLTYPEFEEAVNAALQAAHIQAYSIGQEFAGSPVVETASEYFGRRFAATQRSYVSGITTALDAGRFLIPGEAEIDAALLYGRLRLYHGAVSGTAQHAWSHFGKRGELIAWKLGAVEEHCSDCPYLADMGPYVASEVFQLENKILPTTPRAGDTPCLMNCKCYLQRQSGLDTTWSFVYAA